MRHTTSSLCLLLGLTYTSNAFADDPMVSDSQCGCSITAMHGLRESTSWADEGDVDIGLVNRGRVLFVVVSTVSNDRAIPQSLATNFQTYSQRRNIRPIGEITYGTVDGRPSASMESVRKFNGLKMRQRTMAVDAGDRTLFVAGFTSAPLWYQTEPLIDEVLATFAVTETSGSGTERMHEWPVELSDVSLQVARQDHTPATLESQNTQALQAPPAETGWTIGRTATPQGGEMPLFSAYQPDRDVRHPTVIWVPHALTLTPSDAVWRRSMHDHETSADAFVRAGFNVIVPTFRGMASNGRDHEYFYGEVDDLLAAIELARNSRNVDPDRIYLAGLRSGGTLALLASVSGAPVRGTFVYDAQPWQFPVMATGGYYRQPFPVSDHEASRLRSAIFWADRLSSPVLYVGTESHNHHAAKTMAELSARGEYQMQVVLAPFSARVDTFRSVVDTWIAAMKADTGEEFNHGIGEHELYDAARRSHPTQTRLR